jgi:hypothetical protein
MAPLIQPDNLAYGVFAIGGALFALHYAIRFVKRLVWRIQLWFLDLPVIRHCVGFRRSWRVWWKGKYKPPKMRKKPLPPLNDKNAKAAPKPQPPKPSTGPRTRAEAADAFLEDYVRNTPHVGFSYEDYIREMRRNGEPVRIDNRAPKKTLVTKGKKKPAPEPAGERPDDTDPSELWPVDNDDQAKEHAANIVGNSWTWLLHTPSRQHARYPLSK